MFLSYLQSMQTKSQDAQNPGLWINGNRMPMQEELARKLDPSASSFFKAKSGGNNHLQLVAPPVDADANREVTPEEAAKSAALSAEIEAAVKADRIRVQLQDRDKVVTDTRNPLEYAKEPTYDELDQRAEAIKRRRAQGLPVYSPDSAYEQDQNSAKAVVAGLQENTKRSIFLTHLQNWTNGNRMPMQEAVKKSAVPVKLVDADTNREVTPDEADMHADTAAMGTSKNRLGSEIGHHPLDVNDDGAVVPEERRANAAPAENWATMAARHVSRQAANPGTGSFTGSIPATTGSDAY